MSGRWSWLWFEVIREQRDELRTNWAAIGRKSEAVVGGVKVVGELEGVLLWLLKEFEWVPPVSDEDIRTGAIIG